MPAVHESAVHEPGLSVPAWQIRPSRRRMILAHQILRSHNQNRMPELWRRNHRMWCFSVLRIALGIIESG